MQTAAAYIRVSTEDQTEYSPDSQLKKIQEYARSHDFFLPEDLVFVDEGISGRSARKRPAFMKMIGMAKQKPRPFDLILVWKFSRFARSRQDSILYKSMLRKDCGIHVMSITEQLSDDPTAILIEALLEAMDEYYSINLAQEVRRGMNEKFSRGEVVSAPPFGYRMGTGRFEPDPEKAPLIPIIYRDFLNGMSCRQIAARLNGLGIRTNRGNPFESRSVKYILTNPTYLGKLRRTAENPEQSPASCQNRISASALHIRNSAAANSSSRHDKQNLSMILVDGKHLPLVDQETFCTVQNRIAEIRHMYPAAAETVPARYLLQGLVRCSSCGSILTSAEKGRSLQCHRYAKGLCTQSHHIRLDILNRAFLSGLKTDLTAPVLVPPSSETKPDTPETALIHPEKNPAANMCRINVRIRRPDAAASETDVLSHLLKQETKRMERIKTAYETGIDSLEEYRKNRKAADERLQKLKKEIKQSRLEKPALPKQVSFPLARVPALLTHKKISESAKNEMLKAFISCIIFDRSQNTIQIHYHA